MSARRLTSTTLASLCAMAGVLMWWGASAQAEITHNYLSQIAEVPQIKELPKVEGVPGRIIDPATLTVDSGELYVAEHVEGTPVYRTDLFDAATGAFISQLEQTPASIYGASNGVAVGHATGTAQVYVGAADSEPSIGEPGAHGVVAVFDSAGHFLTSWNGEDTPNKGFGFEYASVAVDSSVTDPAAGDVYVTDEPHKVVDVFKPEAGGKEKYETRLTGTSPTEPFNDPFRVTVDESTGDVLVLDATGSGDVVDIFEPEPLGVYKFVRKITGPSPSESFSGQVTDLAVDGNSGEIYVAEGEAVLQFSFEGAYLGRITGAGTPAGSFGGAASVVIDPATHDVYVGDRHENRSESVVDFFGPDVVIPDVTSEPATKVQLAGATLNGTVNPAGVQVSDCHFDYGETTAYGHTVPCAQSPAEIGAGTSPVAVSAEAKGLTPGVLYHFRLSAANANGANTGSDQLWGPPKIDSESAANVTQTAATLQAQINPDRVDTTYRFEYGTTTSYGTDTPIPNEDLGSGGGDRSVSVEIGKLQAGVTYHYRVLAVNAAGTVTESDKTFTTVPPARIDAVTISNILATSATVQAKINPLGTDTSYRFEYGPSTSYGASIPVAGEDIGAGTSDVTVTQQLSGLQPNTTYHVRVVTQNALGTERSDDHTFVYDTNGFALPDNRAYEMVTPPNKNGTLIPPTPGLAMFPPDIAGNGQRVIASAIGCFGDAESCNANRGILGAPAEFTRTPEGWVATSLEPPANTPPGVYSPNIYSADAGTALFNGPTPPGNEDDFYARLPEQPVLDVGPLSPPAGGPLTGGEIATAATADLSRVLWQYGPVWEFDHTHGTSLYEYAGADNAAPMLVGVSGGPHSTDLVSVCETQLAGGTPNALSADGHTIFFTASGAEKGSCKGSGANASTVVPANELFARIDNSEADEAETHVRAHTVAISQPNALAPAETEPDTGCTSEACTKNIERSPAPEGNPSWRGAEFAGASADGSRVFFTSTQQLTNEASEDSRSSDTAVGQGCDATSGPNGCNLYLYDFSRPEGHRLIDVSAGDTMHGPQVQGVMAVSSDGSHVYFVAKGELTEAANGQGQVARNGAENLYVFDADTGHTTFIAALCSGAGESGSVAEPRCHGNDYGWTGGREANVTPDGRYLVFTSTGQLTADTTRTDGAAQVFRYDAGSGSLPPTLVRVSIGLDGFNDNGNAGEGEARIVPANESEHRAGPGRSDPTMSNDGAFVFFESPIGLVPQALNDVILEDSAAFAENVYEWHEGHVHLISDGRDAASTHVGLSAVQLIGSDESGANVFFSTADQLLPTDTDTQVDFYDARICEPERGNPCIQSAPPALGPCLGEACHGVPPASPLRPNVPTSTFEGQGNLAAQSTSSAPTSRSLTRAQKLAAALRACHRRRGRRGRASCEKSARKRYDSAQRATHARRLSSTGRAGR